MFYRVLHCKINRSGRIASGRRFVGFLNARSWSRFPTDVASQSLPARRYGACGPRRPKAARPIETVLDTHGAPVVEVPVNQTDLDRILNRRVREPRAALPV
jgi:hypothetical protein